MKSKKNATYVKKSFVTIKMKKKIFKLYQKVRDHCHYTGKFRGAAHSICNLNYKVHHEITVKIHNGSTYDYHFIIKELAEEFKGQFECLGENLLITYPKLTIRIAKHALREKISNQNVIFFGLKNNTLNYRYKECKETSTK